MTTDPALSRSLEIERKYDADADTPLPEWGGAAVSVSASEIRMLDAIYFDTADLALARADIALRRRTGGPDAGWHIKGPRRGDARLELGWPLSDEIPEGVIAALAEWAAPPFAPLARIQNTRHASALSTKRGVLAEFVDDHVTATNLRSGAEQSWREWEVELAAPADEAEHLFATLEQAIFATGARPSASASKLARALGA